MKNPYSLRFVLKNLPRVDADMMQRAYAECGHYFASEIRKWYSRQPKSFFDGPHHPNGRARSYMRGIIAGWAAGEQGGTADALHAVFMGANAEGVFTGLRLHQIGGTITPKRAKMLTVPITPQAHGLDAKGYAATIGHKLFRIRRKDPSKPDLLAYKDTAGELHAAFALKHSVYVPPLKERRGYDALPSDTDIKVMASRVLGKWLREKLGRI